ncbi:hypothetical protein [Methylosinus sporium]|uniref:hypothetical protein n=1 Tax=Methylosinus sporium TaxID=428 RepID=UPI0011B2222E|nr:hypothetical protein [Methylosinus sporium]
MTNICLIGDSHSSALRFGIEANGVSTRHALTYFGLHCRHVPALRIRERKVEAETEEARYELAMASGGQEMITIDSYDEFLIVGFGLYIGYVVSLYRNYRSDCMPGPTRGRYLLSDSCFLATSQRLVEGVEAFTVIRLIRSITDKPITLVATPNPGAGLEKNDMPADFPPFYAALEHGDAEAIAMIFREVCNRLAATHGVRIVPPITEASENGLFNRREFSLLTDQNIATSDPIGAMLHGSDTYGVILARSVFP